MTEQLKIPKEAINANWKDDIDLDFETYGNSEQEMEYISPNSISKESIDKIKARKLKERGHKILLFSKNEKLLA